MSNNLRVAVIGPFFNAEEHVEPWVSGVAGQHYSPFKLYLVDDASTDRTPALLTAAVSKLSVPFSLTHLVKNSGPAAVRNGAIRQAVEDGAELILILDADCRVADDWIQRHVAFHRQRPDIDVMGGAMNGIAQSWIGRADGFCSWFTSVPYTRSGEVKALHLPTTNMSFKSAVIARAGFFDESLNTGEDVVFCRKVRQSGGVLWFQSDIIVTHLDRDQRHEAKRHHYRWGLHSYTLSVQAQGGYYSRLTRIRNPLILASLVPIIAALNTLLVLFKYTRRKPSVWLHLPWILLLKWYNAVGVYRGFLNPSLCRRG
ncbi:hypothetical protein CCP3SC15_470007 [Gammaproteobacteria bacterium]